MLRLCSHVHIFLVTTACVIVPETGVSPQTRACSKRWSFLQRLLVLAAFLVSKKIIAQEGPTKWSEFPFKTSVLGDCFDAFCASPGRPSNPCPRFSKTEGFSRSGVFEAGFSLPFFSKWGSSLPAHSLPLHTGLFWAATSPHVSQVRRSVTVRPKGIFLSHHVQDQSKHTLSLLRLRCRARLSAH